jgi:hypothetical protein
MNVHLLITVNERYTKLLLYKTDKRPVELPALST